MTDIPQQPQNFTGSLNHPIADLESEKGRLQTLYRCHIANYFKADLDKIAKGGFYYDDGKFLKCYYCKLGIKIEANQNYTKLDHDHKTYSKNCPLLNQKIPAIRNIPLAAQDSPPLYYSYFEISMRINSFNNYAGITDESKNLLANAGFFNAGFNNKIICFQCGKHVNDWKPGVDVWEKHIICNDACLHIARCKDEEYIMGVKQKMLATSTLVVERKDDRQSNMCLLCKERPKEQLISPCGHIIVCEKCAEPLNVCPSCYQIIESKFKFYYP